MISHFPVIEYLYRMSDNHSQLDHEPSESSLGHCNTQTNIDEVLSAEFVTANPSPFEVTTTTTTSIVVNRTRQIPTATVQNTPTARQLARRRRHQRRRQRQRDRQIDTVHEQHQRQRRNWMPSSPPLRRQRADHIQREPILRHLQGYFWNPPSYIDPRPQPMDSSPDESLLDAYESERIHPRDTWEQDRLHEFEGFVVLEHLQQLDDELERQEEIAAEERLQEARRAQRTLTFPDLNSVIKKIFLSFKCINLCILIGASMFLKCQLIPPERSEFNSRNSERCIDFEKNDILPF